MSRIKFRFLDEQVDKLFDAAITAASDGGKEICGLLVYNGYYIELVHTRNKIKKGGSFAFYVNDIRYIQKSVNALNHEIIGTFHSHPLYIDEPSESDIKNTIDDSFMVIVDVTDLKLGLWYIKDGKKSRCDYKIIKSQAL